MMLILGAASTIIGSDEKTNYSRLCCLLINVGVQVLRDTFDGIIPPTDLLDVVKRNPAHSKLQLLRKKRILNTVQWSKLYPVVPSSVSSTGFDPALLLILLRTICNLSPPPAGWDAPPLSVDTSRESDIARVKYFMNALSNRAVEASVSDEMFGNYWQQIRDSLVRLGGADYEVNIDEMKNQDMDPLDEEHFTELLKQWKKVEDSIKDKLNELETEMGASGEEGEPYAVETWPVVLSLAFRFHGKEAQGLGCPSPQKRSPFSWSLKITVLQTSITKHIVLSCCTVGIRHSLRACLHGGGAINLDRLPGYRDILNRLFLMLFCRCLTPTCPYYLVCFFLW